MNIDELKVQLDAFPENKLPPVENWNPSLSGEIDIVIKRDGRWFHEGGEIKRHKLVRLFSTILKKEGDDYFLVTPVEKWKISVEDVPFQVVALQVAEKDNQQALLFTTSTEDRVVLSAQHPLRVDVDPQTGEPSPYILVRNGMEGRLNRNTYYQLVEMAMPDSTNPSEYVVTSCGTDFVVG